MLWKKFSNLAGNILKKGSDISCKLQFAWNFRAFLGEISTLSSFGHLLNLPRELSGEFTQGVVKFNEAV